jgi:class 3 adenylate cyclase
MTLGIGIAQGFATIGEMGFAGRMDYGVTGRVMAFASALCVAARGNQILVTTKVAAAVEPITETAAVEGLQLRGVARQFPVFSIGGLKA